MTAHPRLRVALVGALGKVAAPCHLNVLRTVPNVELFAVCDVEETCLRRLAQDHGVDRVYLQFADVLADAQIDVVDLVVPPSMHAEMTIAAARAGKHVYVEKPMAHSRSQALAMIRAAASARVRLMVGESYYFHGPHRLARRLVDQDEVGEVLQVRQSKGPWVFNDSENRRLKGRGHDVPWRVDPRLSGGGEFPWIMDHGPHLFATARLFAGAAVQSVTALPRTHGVGPEHHLRGITAISWTHSDGVADGIWSQVETVPEAGRWIGFRTEILGSQGTIRVFGEGGGAGLGFPQVAPVTLYRKGQARDFALSEGPDRSWISNNSYYDQAHCSAWGHFADAVLNGQPLEYDGGSGLEDLTSTLATIQSAMRKCAIDVSCVDDDWTAFDGLSEV